MRLRTLPSYEHIVYFAIDTNPYPGGEEIGFSIWRLYAGRYNGRWYFGFLNKYGGLE